MTTIIIIIAVMCGITWLAGRFGRFGSECDEQIEKMMEDYMKERDAKGKL